MSTTAAPRRRWFRYSLRSFLLVFTLICVALGWKMNRLWNQRRVVADVEKFGLLAGCDYQPVDHGPLEFVPEKNPFTIFYGKNSQTYYDPPGPRWLRNFLGDDFFADLTSVEIEPLLFQPSDTLERVDLDDNILAHIGAVPTLLELRLSSNVITDRGLASLASLRHLKYLHLESTNITDSGLEHLSNFSELVELYLEAPQITDQGLVHLAKLTQLRRLYLSAEKIQGHGLSELKSLANLHSLGLFEFTNGALTQVANLPQLKGLYLFREQITDTDLASLHEMHGLKQLFLFAPHTISATNAAVEQLRTALPDCEITRY